MSITAIHKEKNMAKKVTVAVLGGQTKTYDDISSVDEVKSMLNLPNHTATLNGEPVGNDAQLDDYAYIALAPAVKGG